MNLQMKVSSPVFSRYPTNKGLALVNWKTTTCLEERTYFLNPPFRDWFRSGHCTGQDRRWRETGSGRDIWVVNLPDNATGEQMGDDPHNEFSGLIQVIEAAPQLLFKWPCRTDRNYKWSSIDNILQYVLNEILAGLLRRPLRHVLSELVSQLCVSSGSSNFLVWIEFNERTKSPPPPRE